MPQVLGYDMKLFVANWNMRNSYLWPGYTEESTNFHVLLSVLIVNTKRREHLDTWSEYN
jgi:intron-binding protein aquarius